MKLELGNCVVLLVSDGVKGPGGTSWSHQREAAAIKVFWDEDHARTILSKMDFSRQKRVRVFMYIVGDTTEGTGNVNYKDYRNEIT